MKFNKINLLVVIFVICLITTTFINSAGLRSKKKNKNEVKRVREQIEPDTNELTESSVISSGGSTLLERNRDENREERRKLSLNKEDDNSDEEEEKEDKKNDEATTTIIPENGGQTTVNNKHKNSSITDKLHRRKELQEINDEFARKVHLNTGGRNKRSDKIHSLGRAKELEENNEIVNAQPKTKKNEKRSVKTKYLRRIKKFDENNPETSQSSIDKTKKDKFSSSSEEKTIN